MGRLTEDMARLRGETDALRNMRQGFIIDLKRGIEDFKEEVTGMQSGFRRDHADMAGNLMKGLGSFMSDLQTSVGGMTAGFSSDRMDMAKKTKAERKKFVADIQETVSDLCDETVTMMSSFSSDRADMAGNLMKGLESFMSDLQTLVDDMTAGFSSDRMDMAKKTKAERKEFINHILQTVNDIKQKNAALRAEFAADIAGARQAWSGTLPVAPLPKVKVERKEKKKVEVMSEEEAEEVSVQAKEIVPDDLTQIKGIGAGRQMLLNKAGIYTYAQLAGSTPDELKEKMGEAATRMAPLDDWIGQAEELAG